MHFESIGVRAYVANHKSDCGFSSLAKRCSVRRESVKLHDSGKGDDNRPAKTLNEVGDHAQRGKKNIGIQDEDGVSWHEL